MPIQAAPFPGKSCRNCCRKYRKLADWQALSYVGLQEFPDAEMTLEYRNCPCGNTLVWRLPYAPKIKKISRRRNDLRITFVIASERP